MAPARHALSLSSSSEPSTPPSVPARDHQFRALRADPSNGLDPDRPRPTPVDVSVSPASATNLLTRCDRHVETTIETVVLRGPPLPRARSSSRSTEGQGAQAAGVPVHGSRDHGGPFARHTKAANPMTDRQVMALQ
jgi:hypothetical protein